MVNKVALHDWLIYAYFRNCKFNWKIDNISYIRYRQHKSNEFGANSNFRAYLKRIFLIKNSWYRTEVEKINKLIQPDLLLNLNFRVKNFIYLRRRLKDALILLIISIFGFY